MKLSVIIPVYNVEKYLAQCLESLENQSVQDFDVILVDDGSSDGSAGICARFCEKDCGRFTYLKKENGGASSARNAGLKQASGEYIYFLDSDDYLAPDAFEKLISSAEKNNADFVFFEAKTVDENGKEIEEGAYTYSVLRNPKSGKEMLNDLFSSGELHFSIPLMFLRRDFLMKNNILCREGIMYEDMIYVFQVFNLAERTAHVHEKLYFRRFRENSVMTSKRTSRNFHSNAVVCRELIDFIKKNNLEKDAVSIRYLVRCSMNALDNYRLLSSQDKASCKAEYTELKQIFSDEKFFGDAFLKSRCSGYLFWAFRKIISKIF